MIEVAFVGWRGMVGSVLMARMREMGQVAGCRLHFFSTSQAGQLGPDIGQKMELLEDAYDIEKLMAMDVILTCQGSNYTMEVHQKLRTMNWQGYWIDAASALRMCDDSIIVLPPINQAAIDDALRSGRKDFIGANCTVSLFLMAVGQLFKEGLVDWMSTMTYQAYSGAGAGMVRAFFEQLHGLAASTAEFVRTCPSENILAIDKKISEVIRSREFVQDTGRIPLITNLIPWIDSAIGTIGQTREEWKATAEANKILGTNKHPVPIDGICVRVGAMRCHSQALTLKLREDLSLSEFESLIAKSSEWTRIIPNTQDATIKHLTPAAVSGTLDIAVGRIRKPNFGPRYFSAFTVGDQLLWGAAEPLRLVLNSVVNYLQTSEVIYWS